ncbi:hypothetical protein DACRYDRAFT_116622 [Dacryopinax primogenitus]|uniref:Uncharacterized protein n=1 Tax=Dacryopinax primogenitus (strain DJM 731) TaxID=1858805 RepID=M5FUN3_DACPD|nr:uncharacterized protein DACRYDRAFT_116622 [Dacryopinax primogenitus]EJU01471.1 hypothetical protein DACRYDRAFT_116622 [Dacryopinax primogenitus]
MPFLVHRRNSPPVVEVHLPSEKEKETRSMSRSFSRKERLRDSLIHLSRYFSRPKSAFTVPSLSSSLSSRSSDESGRYSDFPPQKEKIVLQKTSTPEGFVVISKKLQSGSTLPLTVAGNDRLSVHHEHVRSMSVARRRAQPVPPPSKAQLAALKVYAEKALPPLPMSRPASTTLSPTPPTMAIPPPAYFSPRRVNTISERSTSQTVHMASPTRARQRTSLRPKTPKTPNNTDSFLSFSATPPRRYSFRAAGGVVRTSFLSLTPSPPQAKRPQPAHRYSTTSQRMGLPEGAVLPPGRVELRADTPITALAFRPLYQHPYATATPAPERHSGRYD